MERKKRRCLHIVFIFYIRNLNNIRNNTKNIVRKEMNDELKQQKL